MLDQGIEAMLSLGSPMYVAAGSPWSAMMSGRLLDKISSIFEALCSSGTIVREVKERKKERKKGKLKLATNGT